MFSKAKRFDPASVALKSSDASKVKATVVTKPLGANKKQLAVPPKTLVSTPIPKHTPSTIGKNIDEQSTCSSVSSVKSFVTPKPVRALAKAPASLKKNIAGTFSCKKETKDDIIKAQEVEIRNKDSTISEYNKQIEDLKNKIANLQRNINEARDNNEHLECLDQKLSKIQLNDEPNHCQTDTIKETNEAIDNLNLKIVELEQLCEKLESEVSTKQVELRSLEEIIVIRDSLCKDLQDKLTDVEKCLDETRQRLEMVKGHHALALEANESIRREYKAEIESLKIKLEEEKQTLINKCKADQDHVKNKYIAIIESIKTEISNDKDDLITDLQKQLATKDIEMKAKLDQIDEATREKLKLCEIQFEERSRSIQEHWMQQQEKIEILEKEANGLKYSLSMAEEQNIVYQKEIASIKKENDILKAERNNRSQNLDEFKEESKKKIIDYENEINKLTVEIEKVNKDKKKFEMSLSVTRDIVEVLTVRLRESDEELEQLEGKVQSLTSTNEMLGNELASYKHTFNSTLMECNEYKDALVNILKSKAALSKEHNRIMEHNVSLIESLQNVEKEAYRELGSIKNELIEDVEMIKKESKTQIQMLRDEVENKKLLCQMASEHAAAATVAAEQARLLLGQAVDEIAALEAHSQLLQQQIQDQQSLVLDLSLLRQENEELTMTVAKQSSIVDKLKKDMEMLQSKPKSPAVIRKSCKIGKENIQNVISPLRERNH